MRNTVKHHIFRGVINTRHVTAPVQMSQLKHSNPK